MWLHKNWRACQMRKRVSLWRRPVWVQNWWPAHWNPTGANSTMSQPADKKKKIDDLATAQHKQTNKSKLHWICLVLELLDDLADGESRVNRLVTDDERLTAEKRQRDPPQDVRRGRVDVAVSRIARSNDLYTSVTWPSCRPETLSSLLVSCSFWPDFLNITPVWR